ncbi:MAG TPA: chemotaxis protein CheW [Polyangiales bacterium]
MTYDDELDDDADASSSEHTFLTFLVGDDQYAVPVQCVTEIVRLQKTYGLPDVPTYVRGVINLRGKVIPLLDVRSRFGMPHTIYSDRTVVVVLEHDEASTGLVVDGVCEVTEILPATVESRQKLGHQSGNSMVSGVGMRADGVVFLLDVPTVLSGSRPELAPARPVSIPARAAQRSTT